ncbi:MAG: hypothetical protein OEY87_08475 [Gammaproteobacteria bacterium]|nr:hypothetical protein [Gammaproteobacteria bacterium]MDH5736141.1 hypothetical protein [Gammaproteobacteria bacterium]
MNDNRAEIIDMFPEDHYQLDTNYRPDLRDVTSSARLFNFKRPVYMSYDVWDDCVDLKAANKESFDELAVLQRLRHVLFMAASVLQGRVDDLQYNFRIYRVPNTSTLDEQRRPEPVDLQLVAHKDEYNRPIITIQFPAK